MRGDGHTAYGGESACIDAAVERYMNTKSLPAQGTSCKQDTTFEAPQALQRRAAPAAVKDRPMATRVPGQ
jgi:hypothetical protein